MADLRPRSELLDRVLSASAALVAVSALLVSVYQAKIAREQQKMSAWPYVQLPHSNAHGSQLLIQNVGLGPALVRTVEVTVDGHPVRTWGAAFDAVAGADTTRPTHTTTTDVGIGTVLLPGSTTEILRVESPPTFVARFDDAARRDRLVLKVCYCSLYQDCWTADSRTAEPSPTRACTADSTRAFGR